MGAWGAGAFENDSALDWIADLERTGIAAIESGLKGVLNESDDNFLESTACEEAIAAASVIAAAHGRSTTDLPEGVTKWLSQTVGFIRKTTNAKALESKNLRELAAQAVSLVATSDSSELKSSWEESESKKEWDNAVRDLQKRLEAR